MTMNSDDLEASLINITAECSPTHLIAGQANTTHVTIKRTSHTDISIKQGDKIAFPELPDSWNMATTQADWQVSTYNERGQEIPCLEYQGASSLPITPLAVSTPGKQIAVDQQATSLQVEVSLTPPQDAPDHLTFQVELLHSNNQAFSNAVSLTFSLVQPSQPLVAFAVNPTSVLLSQAGGENIAFPNSIACSLLNQSKGSIESATISLSLEALDSKGKSAAISAQTLKSITLAGGLTWTYDSTQAKWTTTLSSLTAGKQSEVTISNFVLQQDQQDAIALVQATFEISGIATQQAYKSAAWFQAYGPYSISASLDTTQPNAVYYSLPSEEQGGFTINHVNPHEATPPLQRQLFNTKQQVVYPPLAGGFSWQKDVYPSPSGHALSAGSNTLYYIVQQADGKLQTLTQCIIQFNLLTSDSPAPLTLSTKLSDGTYLGMNLSDQGLSFAKWQNLKGALLQNANLSGVDCSSSDLTSANLSGTNLANATLNHVTSGSVVSNSTTKFPAGWQCVKGYLVGPGANLENADLSGANLSNFNLSGVNLFGANLIGATLTGVRSGGGMAYNDKTKLPAGWLAYNCYLVGPGANLENADLSGANLSNFNLAGVNLSGANLSEATLTGVSSGGVTSSSTTKLPNDWHCVNGYLVGPGANLTNAQLAGASLVGFNLQGTIFTSTSNNNGTNLSSANLTGALLIGAKLDSPSPENSWVNLNNTNLSSANLTDANLLGIVSGGTKINPQTTLPENWWYDDGYLFGPGLMLRFMNIGSQYQHPDFSNMNLSNLSMMAVQWFYVNFTNAQFVKSNLNNVNFTGCNFANTNFSNAHLDSVSFAGCNLQGTNFLNATFSGGPASMGGYNLVGTPVNLPAGWSIQNGNLVQNN